MIMSLGGMIVDVTHVLEELFVITSIFAIFFILVAFFFRRSLRQLVKIFRLKNAITARQAKTVEELGIITESNPNELDFTPLAMKILKTRNIIVLLESERFYLSENELAAHHKNCKIMKFLLPPPYYEKRA